MYHAIIHIYKMENVICINVIDLTVDVVDLTKDTYVEFTCPICMESKRNTAKCSGGHVICTSCLRRYVSVKGRKRRVECCLYSFCKGAFGKRVVDNAMKDT